MQREQVFGLNAVRCYALEVDPSGAASWVV